MRPKGWWSCCAFVSAVAIIGCGDDAPPGQPELVRQPVGPSGGTVSVTGMDLVIPPGALTGTETISVTRTAESPPNDNTAHSPVFRLEPAGLVFVKPVEITIALDGRTEQVTVFWSKLGAPGYDDVGGSLAGGAVAITASNTHFSDAFAGSGPVTLAVSPATVDFGVVTVGSTSGAATVTFTNTGGSAADPVALTAAGAFQIGSNSCTGVLAVGASCVATVSFMPTMVGAATGTLVLTGGGTSATATLTGTGAGTDGLILMPGFQDFGTVDVGTTSAGTTFTLTNTGQFTSGIATATLGGTNPGDFAIAASTCTVALAPGAACTVTVTARPMAVGARTANLALTANPGGTLTAALSVQGVNPPRLDVSPTMHDFGAVPAGTTSAPRTFTITNSGGTTTGPPVAMITGTGQSAFTVVSSTCTGPLAPGATCSLAGRGRLRRVAERNGHLTPRVAAAT
jgi:hypothetical protein